MLIYRLLGPEVEESFTRSWGISYGMDAARQWKDLAQEMLKAVVVMLILERLYLTRNTLWLETYVDYLSLQALLFSNTAKATFSVRPALCSSSTAAYGTDGGASAEQHNRSTDALI